MCSAPAAVYHRVRPRCSFAKRVLLSQSVCRLRNLPPKCDRYARLSFHTHVSRRLNGTSKLAQGIQNLFVFMLWTNMFLEEVNQKPNSSSPLKDTDGSFLNMTACLTNHSLSAAVRRLMFSHRNANRRVFSISIHVSASQWLFRSCLSLISCPGMSTGL